MNFFKKRYKLILVLLLLSGLAVLIVPRYFYVQNQAETQKTQLKKTMVRQTLTLSGEIAAEEKVSLQFQTSGRLSWVGVKEGDWVKRYQAVAQLDTREVRKNLDKYLKSYLDTRWDFDQTRDDNKDKIVTDKIKRILEQSQFDLDKSVLDVELQNLAVEFATLTTPISGVVTKVDAPYAGVNITPSTARFEVINPETYYFELTADQADAVKLKPDTKTKITLDALADEEMGGLVGRISYTPKSGETGTAYSVHVDLPQVASLSGQLRLGMTGDAVFSLKEKSGVLALPGKFIKSDAKGQYVLVGDKKAKTYVQVGLEGDDVTEIVSGLTEGDVIYD